MVNLNILMNHGKVREIAHISEFCTILPNLWLDSYRTMKNTEAEKKCADTSPTWILRF